MVVVSKNQVNSVFFLILVFIIASIYIFILNIEFLAIIYIIIYVGAVAVLFLFVIMMINIRLVELKERMFRYLPLSLFIGFLLFIQLFFLLKKEFSDINIQNNTIDWIQSLFMYNNIKLLGFLLYTYYVYSFVIAGLILFIAMIGSIVLTLYHEVNVKRQNFYNQIEREYYKTIVGKNIKI